MKTTLDRIKKVKSKQWKQAQNISCACEIYLVFSFDKGPFPKAYDDQMFGISKTQSKFTGISFKFKKEFTWIQKI